MRELVARYLSRSISRRTFLKGPTTLMDIMALAGWLHNRATLN